MQAQIMNCNLTIVSFVVAMISWKSGRQSYSEPGQLEAYVGLQFGLLALTDQ